MALRENFPSAGESYLGGESDGWEYRSLFRGTTLRQSYEMLRAFLREEGYGELPLPADVQELLRFKSPKRKQQFILFEDNGYVHNPIKILFLEATKDENTLLLCIYNEKMPQHLLRFHKKLL